MREAVLRLGSAAFAAAMLVLATPALGQVESVAIVTVAGTGCDNDQFHVTVSRASLDGGDPYFVHFVASVGGLVYTNQAVSVTTDGSSDYYIYTNFTGGPVDNAGTFPMPAGQPIQIDVGLERPFGKIIATQRMTVDGCGTGSVFTNGPTPAPTPQREMLKMLGVEGVGCNNDVFNVSVRASNLDNGPYTMRAVATSGGLVYMNGHASFVSDATRLQYLYGTFSYGPVANGGTFPIPSGQPVQLDLTLERPAGTVLYARRVVFDGCDTGNVTFDAPLRLSSPPVAAVPTTHPAGLALLGALLGLAFAWQRRRR